MNAKRNEEKNQESRVSFRAKRLRLKRKRGGKLEALKEKLITDLLRIIIRISFNFRHFLIFVERYYLILFCLFIFISLTLRE